MTELLDLGAGPLSRVLQCLPLQDMLRVAQACKLLHSIAQNDVVWHVKALESYPAETVRLGEAYASYQALVRDDNSAHAALLLPLAGRSCRYKHNRAAHHYECLVLALEWHRTEQSFRLYFEARGEADLRQPSESSLGFVVHRGDVPNRPAMARQLQQLQARWRHLQARVSEAARSDSLNALPQLHRELSSAERRVQQLQLELAEPLELSFADLLTVVRPTGQRLLVDRLGHKLGYLTFDNLNKGDVLLRELPDSYASKQAAQARGIDLCFCYANPIPVMPHGAMVDYEATVVATVPPGATLLTSYRRQGRYVVPGQLLRELEGEGLAVRLQRWADRLPREVLQRNPPWLV